LLAELVSYLSDEKIGGHKRSNAEAMVLDLLAPVPLATIDVRLPITRPASAVAEALMVEPSDGSSLAQWGRRVGASERTLARLFLAETGLQFGRWRTVVRLRAALPQLADGMPVSTVATKVGYEASSAFVAAFRRQTGVTPGSYFRDRAGNQG
jgi:AraC-like DNA-binding protein